MRPVSLDTTVAVTTQQVSTLLGDETVILHTGDGVYYGLDHVGTSIWNLLQQPRTVREIRDHIVDEYEVDPQRCEQELIALLQALIQHGLIAVTDTVVPVQ